MLAGLDPRSARARRVPARGAGQATTRGEAERAGLAAARRPESQEACFLAGGDYRAFLGRHGLAAADGAVVAERRERARTPRRLLAVHARPAARPRRRGGRAALRSRHATRRRTPSSSARAPRSRARSFSARAASTSTPTGSTRSSATARRRWPRTVEPTAARLPARPRRARVRRRAGQAAVLYEGDVVVGCGVSRQPPTDRTRMLVAHSPPESSGSWRSRSSCSPSGSRWRSSSSLAGTVSGLSAFIKGTQEEVLPVIHKVGETRGPRERAARQGRPDHRQRRGRGGQRRHRGTRGQPAITRPVHKMAGFAAGVSFGAADFKARRDWRDAVQAGKEPQPGASSDLVDELREAGDVTDDEITARHSRATRTSGRRAPRYRRACDAARR